MRRRRRAQGVRHGVRVHDAAPAEIHRAAQPDGSVAVSAQTSMQLSVRLFGYPVLEVDIPEAGPIVRGPFLYVGRESK